MKTAATAGTFNTNLSIFKCVNSSGSFVTDCSNFLAIMTEQLFNMHGIAEIGLQSPEYDKALCRTPNRTRCEIRSSLILTVQHLCLVSRITLCSACGEKKKNKQKTVWKHSKTAILNVNIDLCSLPLAFSNSPFALWKTLWFWGFNSSFFLLNKQGTTRRRELENVK